MGWPKAHEQELDPVKRAYSGKLNEDTTIYAYVQIDAVKSFQLRDKEGNPLFKKDRFGEYELADNSERIPLMGHSRDIRITWQDEQKTYWDIKATLWHEAAEKPGDLLVTLFAAPPSGSRKSANVKVSLDPEFITGDINPNNGKIYAKYDPKQHKMLLGRPRYEDMSPEQEAAWKEHGHFYIDPQVGDGYNTPKLEAERVEVEEPPQKVVVGAGALASTHSSIEEDDEYLDWD